MYRPTLLARAARLSAVAACLAVAAAAFADEAEDLAAAIQLFEDGRYLAAQEALLKIEPESLTEAQRTQRGEYVDRVQVALAMVEKANQDLDDAVQAVTNRELDQAEQLLRKVLNNEYAAAALRREATDQLRRVAALREAQADAGSGPPSDSAGSPDTEEVVQAETVSETASIRQAVVTGQAAPPDEQAGTQDARRARVFTDQGFEMLEAGRYAEAQRLFEQALQYAPGHPEAVRGLERIRAHEDVEAGPTSLIDQLRREALINWRRSVSRYREAEREVRELLLQDRYDQAKQVLLRARQIVEAGRQFAEPLTKYESLLSEYNALANYVADEERRYNEDKVLGQREEIRREQRKRQELIRQNRQQQIDLLMDQAVRLRKDRDFGGAVDTLEQVMVIDPHNEQARWLIEVLQDFESTTRQRQHRRDLQREARDVLRDVEGSKVPWHETAPRYPEDWAEISSSPYRAPTGRERLSAQDLALHDKLEQSITVAFEDQAFQEVIDLLAEGQGVNVTVLWNDLEAYGIDRETPVTLQLASQITFKKALDEILDIVGGSEVELGFLVGDGVIKIATKDWLDQNVLVDVYDIRDLLMVVPDFTDAPAIDLTESSGGGGGGRGGGGGGDESIFGDDDDDDDEEEGDEAREQRILDLLDLIRNTIEPESWREMGGVVASIAELNGQLVVTQTASAHEEVADLLSKLRAQQAIQVAVESRFITVQSNFLEELGLDLDIVLNNGNAGFDFIPNQAGNAAISDTVMGTRLLVPRSFSSLGFGPAVPGVGQTLSQNFPGQDQQGGQQQGGINQPFGFASLVPQRSGVRSGGTPIPAVSNILSLTDPTGLNTDLPGSFAGNQTLQPAFSVFGSFLDNIQVDFLIRATQADARSTVLTAPRVVLFNGQRSWVAVANQQSFVSELQPVVASGAAAQAPEIGVLSTGAVLDVRATVSADRRYVTMTLQPAVGRLLDIQNFLFTTGPNVGAGTSGFVQLPSISRQAVKTTVSVPDGGTLLIGGQKLAGEVEIEAGVPILSKIPILKRLYSSRTLVKDEQVLLILVKPRIIIQQEAEERAFPLLSTRG
ncbi:MAG: type II secretion system protein GspD [Planctomycetota bacterium]